MTRSADLLRKIILALALCSVVPAILFMVMLWALVTKPIIQLSRQVKLVGFGSSVL
jgi:two-component system sensor histidine kinase YesM